MNFFFFLIASKRPKMGKKWAKRAKIWQKKAYSNLQYINNFELGFENKISKIIRCIIIKIGQGIALRVFVRMSGILIRMAVMWNICLLRLFGNSFTRNFQGISLKIDCNKNAEFR